MLAGRVARAAKRDGLAQPSTALHHNDRQCQLQSAGKGAQAPWHYIGVLVWAMAAIDAVTNAMQSALLEL